MAGELTARKLIARLENWPQDVAGTPVVDTGWFRGAVYEELLSARSAVCKADMQANPWDWNIWPEQTIGCIQMEEVPTEECPCLPPSGCTWYRTIAPVPYPVGEYKSINAVGGNLQLLEQYTYRDWFNIKDVFFSRIPAERNREYYTRKNGYIYTLSPAPIAVTATFRDPIEAARKRCDGTTDRCTPFLDFDLFIPPQHEQTILQLAFQAIVGMRGAAAMDTTNNAQPPQGIEPIKPQ